MRSLNLWIEAQLKRGYSANRIKSVLVKRGYPPEAVAEVDRIKSSISNREKKIAIFPKGSKRNLILVAILLGIVIFAFLIYSYIKIVNQGMRDNATSSEIDDSKLLTSEEKECLDILAQYDPSISAMSFEEYLADKHIDLSNGTNIRWKVGLSGEEYGIMLWGFIPGHQNTVYAVTSNTFEGCGKLGYNEEMFQPDEHYVCSITPSEYLIASKKGEAYSFLRYARLLGEGNSYTRILYLKNDYYDKAYNSLIRGINNYGCQKV